MPAFPEAFIDDVASGVQRDYQAGRERRNMMADNNLAGIQLMAERYRGGAADDGRLIGAAVAQAYLGTNNFTSNTILGDNAVARQPWNAPVTPVPGPGVVGAGVKPVSGTTPVS